jgi:FAD-dependent urate hydroxylase
MANNSKKSTVAVIGAGPYGLSAAAYLRAAGVETKVFGKPMAFWQDQMPVGMCLRSNFGASHIADPRRELTFDEYCLQKGNHVGKPIPIERFVDYGLWYQQRAVPDVDERFVRRLERDTQGFKLTLSDREELTPQRVVVACGIGAFVTRPAEFAGIPSALASHTSEHKDLGKFKGLRVVVIGGGQSALESAALLNEAGTQVEVIARTKTLNWVGLHPRMHHLGVISKMLYSSRDVGPAGISRLVAMPHLFRRFPRHFQNRTAYRAIRPAGAGWLQSRIQGVPITLGRKIVSAATAGSELRLRLDDGSERVVDHALLATGFRVDISRYPFLSQSLLMKLETTEGYPVLGRGLESSIPGLHFLGKPAAWSFGPLLGFVSGAEFASNELVRFISRKNGHTSNGKN